jgi:hypothetical protein
MMLAAGLRAAAVKALGRQADGMTTKAVCMLVSFMRMLSPKYHEAALKVLLVGNVLQLTVGQLPNTEGNTLGCALEILELFVDYLRTQNKVIEEEIAKNLFSGAAKLLLEVRNMAVRSGKRTASRSSAQKTFYGSQTSRIVLPGSSALGISTGPISSRCLQGLD